MKIYETIAAVQSELAQSGISKTKRNAQQGYDFRGIDDVLNALSPILAKHKLCILPRCLERTVTERQTMKGGALFYVTVKVDHDLVADDGSKHTVTTYGEAMDSGDKATNKAMSAAYKYAAFLAFCIPTEEMKDADADEPHEVAAPVFDDNSLEDTCIAIGDASDIDELKSILKKAKASGASDDQMKVLTAAASSRKSAIV